MRSRFLVAVLCCSFAFAQQPAGTPQALTIYNQNFAVVRQPLRLELKAGSNNVRYTGVTAQLEPDSVVLRDPAGKRSLQILEQNYQGDPVSMQSLLEKYQGQTIKFEVRHGDKIDEVTGRIVRAGGVGAARSPGYPQQHCYNPPYGPGCQNEQPLIEVNGNLQFNLPGTPLFPALPPDTNLLPTLDWTVTTDRAGPLEAELSYITTGMTWEADYNVIAPPVGDVLDLVGWVTMDNRTGKTFENARIALMAGDVNKVQPGAMYDRDRLQVSQMAAVVGSIARPPVTEKTFDEYHLYTLERAATLRDRETKQVEFIRAPGVSTKQVYIYDGVKIDVNRYNGWGWDNIRNDHSYGTESNPKVWVMREFVNSQ